jgi:hypothetical protein
MAAIVHTNFQIETAATAFLCGYLIMKITEAIHGCDYCLSHLQDSNSKNKIPYWNEFITKIEEG